MRRLIFCFAFALAAFSSVAAPHVTFAATHRSSTVSSSDLAQFESERAALKHCPRDVVVWLNTNSGIWHEKGMRWYGHTKHGAYVCRQEAAAVGDRVSYFAEQRPAPVAAGSAALRTGSIDRCATCV